MAKQKPKRRKKYNHAHSTAEAASALNRLHHVCVVQPFDGVQVLMNYKRKTILSNMPLTASAVYDLPHHWTYYPAVICRSEETYIQSLARATPDKRRTETINPEINSFTEQLIGEANPNHLVTAAFVAVPDLVEIPEPWLLDMIIKAMTYANDTQPEKTPAPVRRLLGKPTGSTGQDPSASNDL